MAINDALGRLARCGAGAGRGRHGRAGRAGRAGGGGGGVQCTDTGGGRVLCVWCVWWRLCGRRRLCGCGRRRGGGARLHVHRLPQGLQARDEPRLPHDDPPAKAAAVRDGGHGRARGQRPGAGDVPGLRQDVWHKVPGEGALPAPPLQGGAPLPVHKVWQALRRAQGPDDAHEVVRQHLRVRLVQGEALLARRAQAPLQVLFARARVARAAARPVSQPAGRAARGARVGRRLRRRAAAAARSRRGAGRRAAAPRRRALRP
mmetsp:Transcript_36716/g.109204  ORF Transcript_36716/g.109204 Transcript_36716/m.109204 type:complete len:260 (+) Transcript_36716:243-1022(+)